MLSNSLYYYYNYDCMSNLYYYKRYISDTHYFNV